MDGQQRHDEQSYDERMAVCPLCSSDEITLHDVDYHGALIERCARCGVKFMNPQHSDAHLRSLYGGYTELPADAAEIASPRHEWRRSLNTYYLSLVERYTPRGRLLSVGSGDGVEVHVAQTLGWEVEAYEFDPGVSRFLTDALGVKTWAGEFAVVPFDAGSFDCVYLHHVLEHPKRPQEYLQTIHRILRPGGALFVACPNIESPTARWKTLMGRLGLKGRRGRHYDTWHHLFYYSPRVLKGLLEERFGFDVVHVRNGLGERMRGRSSASLRRAMVLDGLLPVWKSVFVLIARRR